MSRKSESETIYIQEVFPNDYKQISDLFSVNGNKIKLREEKGWFQVHPEYDLPYKLRNMILSSSENHRVKSFYELLKDGKVKHKGNIHWKDYVFQIPGIYEMLGIKRGYFVERLEDVFQNPLLFLFLAGYKISSLNDWGKTYCELYEDLVELIEKALEAYEQKQNSNRFTEEQLEFCSYFILGTNVFSLFPERERITSMLGEKEGWLSWNREKYKSVKLKLEDFINNYFNGRGQQTEKIDREYGQEKGKKINFPRHLQAIFLGLYKYHLQLPFVMDEEEWLGGTLWSSVEMTVESSIEDKELFAAYGDLMRYLVYKESMEHSRRTLRECREIETIDGCLKRYYTFCMGTLYEIFSGEAEYKEAARDSFERSFSLYLFKKETDLLYEKIELVALSIVAMQEHKEQEEQMKIGLAKYVAEFFASEVLHDIFYSPGIYHRVLLAQYINDVDISADEMEEIYVIFGCTEKTRPPYKAEKIRNLIADINKKYQYEEERHILSGAFQGETIGKIKELCKEVPGYQEYQEYYNRLEKKYHEMTGIRKGTLPAAKNVAKGILCEGRFKSQAYRILHFWVIFSSFCSENDSCVDIKMNNFCEGFFKKLAKNLEEETFPH